jgi:hypothetical protein
VACAHGRSRCFVVVVVVHLRLNTNAHPPPHPLHRTTIWRLKALNAKDGRRGTYPELPIEAYVSILFLNAHFSGRMNKLSKVSGARVALTIDQTCPYSRTSISSKGPNTPSTDLDVSGWIRVRLWLLAPYRQNYACSKRSRRKT